MRARKTLALVTCALLGAACSTLPPAEPAAPETRTPLELASQLEDEQLRAPMPPEVTDALFACAERLELADLRMSSAEEARLRRCLLSEQRSFMGAARLIVDWEVDWLKDRLAAHRVALEQAAPQKETARRFGWR